jgi:hypothetical protein
VPFVPKVLAAEEGLRLQSGPGRDLVFKATGEDTGGAFDYFTVEVSPHGGPPLHGNPDRETVAAVFEKYGMTLLGPPPSPD